MMRKGFGHLRTHAPIVIALVLAQLGWMLPVQNACADDVEALIVESRLMKTKKQSGSGSGGTNKRSEEVSDVDSTPPWLPGARSKCNPEAVDYDECLAEQRALEVHPASVTTSLQIPGVLNPITEIQSAILMARMKGNNLSTPLTLLNTTWNMVEPAVAAGSDASEKTALGVSQNDMLSDAVLHLGLSSFPEARRLVGETYNACVKKKIMAGFEAFHAKSECRDDSINLRTRDDGLEARSFELDPATTNGTGRNPDGTDAELDNPFTFEDSQYWLKDGPERRVDLGDLPFNPNVDPYQIRLSDYLFVQDRRNSLTDPDLVPDDGILDTEDDRRRNRENIIKLQDSFRKYVGDAIFTFPQGIRAAGAAGPKSIEGVGHKELTIRRVRPALDLAEKYAEKRVYYYTLITHIIYRWCTLDTEINKPENAQNAREGDPEKADRDDSVRPIEMEFFQLLQHQFDRNNLGPIGFGTFSDQLSVVGFPFSSNQFYQLFRLADTDIKGFARTNATRCDRFLAACEKWTPEGGLERATGSCKSDPPQKPSYYLVTPDWDSPNHPRNFSANPDMVKQWTRASYYLAGKIAEADMLMIYKDFFDRILTITSGTFGRQSDMMKDTALELISDRLPLKGDISSYYQQLILQLRTWWQHQNRVHDAQTGKGSQNLKNRREGGSEAGLASPLPPTGNTSR